MYGNQVQILVQLLSILTVPKLQPEPQVLASVQLLSDGKSSKNDGSFWVRCWVE